MNRSSPNDYTIRRCRTNNKDGLLKSSSSDMAFFDTLPDEIVLKIVTMAAVKVSWSESQQRAIHERDHDFLVDALCKVSVRFRRVTMEKSLWKGCVKIHQNGDPRKADFVVNHCFHNGSKGLILRGAYEEGNLVLLTANPTTMFPSLSFVGTCNGSLVWAKGAGRCRRVQEAMRRRPN